MQINKRPTTEYKYLKDAPGRNLNDILLITRDNIEKGTSLVIKDRIKNRYMLFNNYEEFAKAYPEDLMHTCDEVIYDWMEQRLKFDVDGESYEQFCEIYNCISSFMRHYAPNASLVPLDSSGIVHKPGEQPTMKYSYHIIASGKVPNAQTAHAIAKCIYEKLSEAAKKAFDLGVYKSIQNFRTPLSTKDGRKLTIPTDLEGFTREDFLITNCLYSPKINFTVQLPKEPKYNILSVSPEYLHKILSKVKDHLVGWELRKNIGNYLIFDRTVDAQEYCDICKREHTRDNTLRLILGTAGSVLRTCIRAEGKSVTILPPEKSISPIEYYSAKKYLDPDIVANCKFKNYIVYSDKKMQEVFKTHKTLYVRGNMKIGKTEVIINYMRNFQTIIFVSSRKSLTAEKMSVLAKYGFNRYDKMEGKICIGHDQRTIVQVESLHRIDTANPPDLVILDESESVIEQFQSSTMKHMNNCYKIFEWLLNRSKGVIALDANLDVRTVNVIRHFRGTGDEILIHNKYKNFTGDVIKPLKKCVLTDKILAAVGAGKNIVVPTNSRKYSDALKKMINDKYPNTKMLCINSGMSEIRKQEIFSNINKSWKEHQVVIYTPTCSAGVSFTEKHFDSVYAYFTNSSTTVETARQMLYRARDVASRTYYVCIETQPMGSRINNIEELEKLLVNMRYMRRHNELPPCNYNIANNGAFEYIKDGLYNIWIWNKYMQIESQTKFISKFIEQSVWAGAKIDISEYRNNPQDTTIPTKYAKAMTAVKVEDDQLIVNAPDISREQYVDLTSKGAKNVGEQAAIERYNLRAEYNFMPPKVIDLGFVKTYNRKEAKNIYANLWDILQNDKLEKALRDIKLKEDTIPGTINNLDDMFLKTNYLKHFYANKLISICGFNGIRDTSEVKRETILKNIKDNEKYLKDHMEMICMTFGPKKNKLQKYDDLMCILKFINGVTNVTYGLSILMKSQNKNDRNTFSIKHNYLGVLFANTASDKIPFVLAGNNYIVI